MDRHILATCSWIGFALWIGIPDIMVIVSTIFAFLWGSFMTYLVYAPDSALPTGAKEFSALLLPTK